jgi:hypothetical protein
VKPTDSTLKGDNAYNHSMDHLLEYFSKGGSYKSENSSFYLGNDVFDPLELFKLAWYTGREKECLQLAFWTRDCRGGAGARKNFRSVINWLANTNPEWVKANINLIPEYGRWDDLKSLYNTPCEEAALNLWKDALLKNDASITPLAAKWAGRQDVKLRKHMGMNPKEFRKMVSKKSGDIVEKKMCAGQWDEIDYSSVPSVALTRYTNAFDRHSTNIFKQWRQDVVSGNADANVSVAFPHDIVRLAKRYKNTEDGKEFVDALFEKLPNFIEDPNIKIMPICDFSGSMEVPVAGSVTAMDVSLSLGLYCSDKLGKDNPFYRKLIPFSNDAKLESWKDMNVVDAVDRIPNGFCGTTNITSALMRLLEAARFLNVKPKDMVNTLLIFSDMQFDPTDTNYFDTVDYDRTSIEVCIDKWEEDGYARPKIVYWNLVGHDTQPGTKHKENIALVSGFSPSILKATLSNKNITPEDIMYETINKYNVKEPK